MNGRRIDVIIELTRDMLGTVPKDKKIYESYVASKAPEKVDTEKEVSTVDEVEESGWTGFHSDEDGIFIYDYMIRGFIKSALETAIENKFIKKIPAYKKWVDRLLFVYPRRIHFGLTEPTGVLERPLRAMTPKGPRTGLARSDTVAAGTRLTFQIFVLDNSKGLTVEAVSEVLSYGEMYGLGQWRGSGGYGQFKVVKISEA